MRPREIRHEIVQSALQVGQHATRDATCITVAAVRRILSDGELGSWQHGFCEAIRGSRPRYLVSGIRVSTVYRPFAAAR